MAEFQWWLLFVGLVAGGGLVAVVYLDAARRDQDIEDLELPAEAAWIADRLREQGRRVDAATVERVLLEHRAYRLEPPPDRIGADGELERANGREPWMDASGSGSTGER